MFPTKKKDPRQDALHALVKAMHGMVASGVKKRKAAKMDGLQMGALDDETHGMGDDIHPSQHHKIPGHEGGELGADDSLEEEANESPAERRAEGDEEPDHADHQGRPNPFKKKKRF